MGTASEHIDGWVAAGVIDDATAARLRAASPGDATEAAPAPAAEPSVAASMFGPQVTITEVFGYLGAFFLLAAASVAVGAAAGIGLLLIGAVVAGIGVGLGRVDARRSRAAGVAFFVATSYLGVGAGLLAESSGLGWPASGVIDSGVDLTAALAFR